MQQPVAPPSAASHSDANLFHLVEHSSVGASGWTDRVGMKLTRTSDLLVICGVALLMLVDVLLWLTDRVVDTGRLTVSIAFVVPALGGLSICAVALRRRHPIKWLAGLSGTSIVVTIASWSVASSLPPSFAALVALAVLTVGLLRCAPTNIAIGGTALAAIAVAVESLRPWVSAAVYMLVVSETAFGVAVGVGIYLRWSDWRRVAAVNAARISERLEIARELHDMVGHYVSGIVVQAQAARHVATRQPAATEDALARIEVAGNDAMVAMRRMVGGLRNDSTPASPTTWDTIDELLANAVAEGPTIRASIDPAMHQAEVSLVPFVYRILTESLTNVRRHAREATRIDIDISCDNDRLSITVRDDGQTMPPSRFATFGIVGMRERAELLGGSLLAGPEPDGGWLVRAELPMERPE